MRVLVIQGAGMDQRGIVNVEIFGPETLEEINARIETDASALGVEVEIRQSNEESEAAAWIEAATDIDAIIINPSGFSTAEGSLIDALRHLSIPTVEVHASNPSARGVRSTVTPVCKGAICGFGYEGYRLALAGLLATADR